MFTLLPNDAAPFAGLIGQLGARSAIVLLTLVGIALALIFGNWSRSGDGVSVGDFPDFGGGDGGSCD